METEKLRTYDDVRNFYESLNDENPCSSCKIRMMLMEMMNNKE